MDPKKEDWVQIIESTIESVRRLFQTFTLRLWFSLWKFFTRNTKCYFNNWSVKLLDEMFSLLSEYYFLLFVVLTFLYPNKIFSPWSLILPLICLNVMYFECVNDRNIHNVMHSVNCGNIYFNFQFFSLHKLCPNWTRGHHNISFRILSIIYRSVIWSCLFEIFAVIKILWNSIQSDE